MALAKRGNTWHTHFFVDGQRFRQSLDTSDWREAQRLEKELIAQASQGKLSVGRQFARLSFGEAVERYLADRKARVGTASQRSESDHAKPLIAHFESLVVGKVNAELGLHPSAEGRQGLQYNDQHAAWNPASCAEASEALASSRG